MAAARQRGSWKTANGVVAVFFIAAIFLPLCDNLFGLDPMPVQKENRTPATMPAFEWSQEYFNQFPEHFEAVYNERFGFRTSLIVMHTYAKLNLLDVSSSDSVIVGKFGWLFFKGDDGINLDYFRGVDPMTEIQVDRWARMFQARQDRLAERGIRYLLIFAPNKSTVYPEYMPDYINRASETTRLDQIVDYLKTHTTVQFVDLRDALVRNKNRAYLYLHTDTHWNEAGELVATFEIARYLHAWFPEIIPLPLDDFIRRREVVDGGDLALLLGWGKILKEHRPRFVYGKSDVQMVEPTGLLTERDWPRTMKPQVFEAKTAEMPRALIIGDSFGMCLGRPLCEHFSRSVFICHNFDMEIIEAEQPDVVVNQVLERYLTIHLPEDSEKINNFYLLQEAER